MTHDDVTETSKNFVVNFLENIIFNVKWVLPLFYFGLILVLGLYGIAYVHELIHIAFSLDYDMEKMKVVVLDMIDVVMIANLVKMIITGSYNSFITKNHGRLNENVSSGQLKIKISTSIVIVALINLLRSFVETKEIHSEVIIRQLIIFGAFLIGSISLAVIEYLHIKGEVLEHKS